MNTLENLHQRGFLKRMILLALAFTFGRWPTGNAAAIDMKKSSMPHPPGACCSWTDKAGNGKCDRSETGAKPCGARKCPGHGNNPKRIKAQRDGAPAGSCALWNRQGQAKYCAICDRKENPCIYTLCPSHKDNNK